MSKPAKPLKKAILVIGNPIDGYRYVGPFDTPGQAVDAMGGFGANYTGGHWWVASIDPPPALQVPAIEMATSHAAGEAANLAVGISPSDDDDFVDMVVASVEPPRWQDTVKWIEVSEERYDEMMGVVPPIMMPDGFLVGEASMHRSCMASNKPDERYVMATYAAFKRIDGKFYASCESLTRPEFVRITHSDVLRNLDIDCRKE